MNGLRALVLAGGLGAVALGCKSVPAVCSPADTVMAAHALECRARVKNCLGDEDCRQSVYADCDDWGSKRCGVDTGAAGAQP